MTTRALANALVNLIFLPASLLIQAPIVVARIRTPVVAATTGVLILATTIGAWINKDAGRKIKFTSAFASALVVTQITLGALVIDTQLHAVLVAIHLGIGILLFAMTLLTVLFAFRLGKQVIESKV